MKAAEKYCREVLGYTDADFKRETVKQFMKHLTDFHEAQNEWISVESKKPRTGKLVTIYTPQETIQESHVLTGIYWSDTKDWTVYDFESSKDLIVTHWKPLPNPPKP